QLFRLVVDGADDARRHADDQRVVGKALLFGDQRAGADDAVVSDPRAIEHDCAHADERVIADRAAVQDDVVTDDAVAAVFYRMPRIRVPTLFPYTTLFRLELDPPLD